MLIIAVQRKPFGNTVNRGHECDPEVTSVEEQLLFEFLLGVVPHYYSHLQLVILQVVQLFKLQALLVLLATFLLRNPTTYVAQLYLVNFTLKQRFIAFLLVHLKKNSKISLRIFIYVL